MRHGSDQGRPTTLAVVLAGLVLLGGVATGLAWSEARDTVREREQRTADLAAAQLSAALQLTIGAIRGADVLAVDGVVDADEFEAFALDVIDGSLYGALAYAQVVLADDRDDFVDRTGIEIRDTDGAGGFVAAPPRERSIVVVDLVPLTDSNRDIIGFDLAGEPVRLAAARAAERTLQTALSERTTTATEPAVGISVLQPVRAPDGTTLGFVTSGLVIDSVLERAGLPSGLAERWELSMDGEVLTGGTDSGSTGTFEVAGRRFALVIDDGRTARAVVPAMLALGTLLLAAVAVGSARRDRRQRADLALAARRSRGISELGRRLASATGPTSVLDEVVAVAARIVDAAHVNVGRRDPDRPDQLLVTHDGSIDPGLASTYRAQPLDVDLPLTECVRTGGPVVVHDAAEHRRRYPAAAADAADAGVASVVCAPLTFTGGTTAGAIGFAFDHVVRPQDLAELLVAATTIAELTSRAFERAVLAEVVQVGAGNLRVLAQALAAAHTVAEVDDAVGRHASVIVGARRALLVRPGIDVEPVPGEVRWPIDVGGGWRGAELRVSWRTDEPMTPTISAVLTTVAEMVAQTLARTALTEQEHQLIVQLQNDLLPSPLQVPGLDIGVRYEPAMNVVGLGGDFYDVIVSDSGRVHLVIGDVTGHGSEAVAVMAELKAVLQHLLRNDAPLAEVCASADAILLRRQMFATAQLVEVDLDARVVRLVNAGHPYPVLRTQAGTAQLLTVGHRALLGLPGAGTTEVGEVGFAPGDVLVLYTDGLVERRSQGVDQVMDELRARIGAFGDSDVQPLLDRLLVDAHVLRGADRIDDDIAVVAVRHCA